MRLNPLGIQFLGPLPSESLVMFHRVLYPMVGWIARQRHFFPNWEVEKIIRVPLEDLLQPENYACYRINFKNGSMLIPRIDMFYQGERSVGTITEKPDSYNTVPDYTLYNARLKYMTADTHWSLSLEAQNLFNKFYWVGFTSDSNDGGETLLYPRTGQPGRPRTLALTLRYNFF